MTLAYGKVLKDPTLAGIAARHRATVAQVALAWAMQLGYAVIPSSTRRENLASNLLARDLRLDAEDMARIAGPSVTAARSVRRAWRRPGTENRVEGPPRCMSGAAEAPVARPVQSSMRYSITPGLSATQSYRRCALWLLSWVCQ